jgi:hypothetical protein
MTATSTQPPRSGRIAWIFAALILLLLLAVGWGFWLPRHRQAAVCDEIVAMGGDYEIFYDGPRWRWLYDLEVPVVGNPFDRVVRVNLGSTRVTDQWLRNLSALRGVRELSLDRTAISDAGVKHLESLSELRDLTLKETRITDRGLESIA